MNVRSVIKVSFIIIVVAGLLGVGAYMYHMNGDSLDFTDTEVRVVISGSMDGEPRTEYDIETIPVGSMVFIKEVPTEPHDKGFYSSLEVGDVVTFHYTHPVSKENMVVTHRIVKVVDTPTDRIFTMAGDSIRDDPTNASEQVITASSGDMIGEVVGVSPVLGDISTYISSAEGKSVLIGLFAAILAVIWVGPMIFKFILSKNQGGND